MTEKLRSAFISYSKFLTMAKAIDTQAKKQGNNKRKRDSTASGTDGGQVVMANGEDQAKKNKRSNKQRVLMLSSRGSTERIRHLMADLEALLPHSKKGLLF